MKGEPALLNGERTDRNRTEAEYRAERLTLEQQAERDCKAAVEYFAPIQSLIDQMFGGLK